MRSFPWPGDDGWPYADSDGEAADGTEDPAAELDDDLVSLHALSAHLYDGLDPLERRMVQSRFGLDGTPVQSWRDLHRELGLPRSDLRMALGSGLSKLRMNLR